MSPDGGPLTHFPSFFLLDLRSPSAGLFPSRLQEIQHLKRSVSRKSASYLRKAAAAEGFFKVWKPAVP